MTVNIIFIHHPQSPKTFRLKDFRSRRVAIQHINAGLTNSYTHGLREASCMPSYASYNSILFETSVILTAWEHINELFDDGPVMVLHTDITPKFRFADTLDYIENLGRFAVGLTVPSYKADQYDQLEMPDQDQYRYSVDPWHAMHFDGVVDIWDLIKNIDPEAWEFAMDTDPVMIYSHQFVASRDVFEELGYELVQLVTQLRLGQCGLWTPHVFERIIAIRLAMKVNPVLLASFSHQSSSGPKGAGSLALYGPRPYEYLRLRSRVFDHGDNSV